MKDKMRILIAYDGSDHARVGLADLGRAGLPRDGEAGGVGGRCLGATVFVNRGDCRNSAELTKSNGSHHAGAGAGF